jgi:hypothetical protein
MMTKYGALQMLDQALRSALRQPRNADDHVAVAFAAALGLRRFIRRSDRFGNNSLGGVNRDNSYD